MNNFKAITTVYSYYFPEIRRLITDLTREYPHNVFLKSIKPGLDDFHIPIIERYLDFQKSSIPNLKDFPFKYPTAGAEESIREFLTFLQAKGIKRIYTLTGEYEGYKEVGKTRCIETVEVDPQTDPRTLEKGFWFISNPSARDGNIIPNDFINKICEAGHKVFYDLTYVGLTELYKFDVSHQNISFVAISFSKPFGLFYYRLGFAFSREEILSLFGNKWFKNIFSLLVVQKIMAEISPLEIWEKYKPIQKKIIQEINKKHRLGIRPGDALLLGYLTKQDADKLSLSQQRMISRFKRGDGYRFCLTPYFEELEKRG